MRGTSLNQLELVSRLNQVDFYKADLINWPISALAISNEDIMKYDLAICHVEENQPQLKTEINN
ncbi:13760_t:CDS:2 [Cetraspora pellucida]|uniref:13760_t:CDS:1 n=1 Tax=Cetraspora pellucida TaxID=1433469 RepID=A0A9N9AQ52_9GLOM|nr:13760_t:CDS:2 [Cetraspora pellucida]